jgi:hypothetical protein
MAFTVDLDAAGDRVRLRGSCRMSDAATLARALVAPRVAARLTIDTTGVADWDIGPAWLLYRALRPSVDGAATVDLDGPPPRSRSAAGP